MDQHRDRLTRLPRWTVPALAAVPVLGLAVFYAWPLGTLLARVLQPSSVRDVLDSPGLGRVLWFTAPGQMLHVGLLMMAAVTLSWLVRMALGAGDATWTIWVSPFTTTLLWPLADRILLWPQRRPVDRDENRPI